MQRLFGRVRKPSAFGPERAQLAAAAGEAILLDVREPDEWAAGRAPGAIHIPLGELSDRAHELGPAALVVVVCRSGSRSRRAVDYLRSLGVASENLDGGMKAWLRSGLPIEPPDGRVQ